MINSVDRDYTDDLPLEVLEYIFTMMGPIEKIWPSVSLVCIIISINNLIVVK